MFADIAKRPPAGLRRIALTALCAPLVILLVGCGDQPTAADASGRAAGPPVPAGEVDGTSLPPWAPPSNVPDRVSDARLDLGPMGMAEHYHPEIEITVAGQEVTVPSGIGVDPTTGAMSGLHTHTADGQLHVEAATAGEVFTLGQLFIEWGVKLSSEQIGGEHAEAGESVTVTVNGDSYDGDPAELRLAPNQQIVVHVQ